MKNPEENTIERKPIRLMLYNLRSNARTATANEQPSNQMPFGMLGGSAFQYPPAAFMQMPPWMMGMMAPPLTVPAGMMNPNPAPAQPQVPDDAEIDFPEVQAWAAHCDANAKRARLGGIGDLRWKLTQEGYVEIDQLIGNRVSQADLANALGIGLGRAGLIIKWADEDVAKVRSGNFTLNTT